MDKTVTMHLPCHSTVRGLDIHINGPAKQRELLLCSSMLQPSHCGEQVTSPSPRQNVFKHDLMEPQTSALKL